MRKSSQKRNRSQVSSPVSSPVDPPSTRWAKGGRTRCSPPLPAPPSATPPRRCKLSDDAIVMLFREVRCSISTIKRWARGLPTHNLNDRHLATACQKLGIKILAPWVLVETLGGVATERSGSSV